jgi:hypothetical protein
MKRTLLIICALVLGHIYVEAKEWRGIVPLHSTRADVERVLGPPVSDSLTGPCKCLYHLEDMIVHVLYADGINCGEPEQRDSRVGGWKVPRDTVVEISVTFRTDRALSDFKIDEEYEKEVDEHLPGSGWIYYTNRKEGVRIEAGKTTVTSVSYFPSVADNNLRCPKKSTRKCASKQTPRSGSVTIR